MSSRPSLHIRQSLSTKLSLSILMLVVPIFIMVLGLLFLQSRHLIKKQATKQASSVLSTTTQRVCRYLNTLETATNANEWFVMENFQPDSLLALSRQIVQLNANVCGCSITTEPNTFPQYGRYFSAYTIREGDSIITVREGEYEYFEKPWYKTPRLIDKACWIDPFNDFNEGTLSAKEMIASYCKPLHDADGRFVGVLSTDLSLRQLSETVLAEQPYPNSYFFMIGEKGNYFIHPDSTRLFKQTIFSGTDPRQQADRIALGHEMTAGNQGSMRVMIDGNPCLICYQPVPGTTWSIAIVCPDSDILKDYYRQAYILTPLMFVGLLVILLFCYKSVENTVNPLNKLLDQSQRIAEGHYDEQIPHTKRTDVIGRLQNSFATMQDSLRHHVNDIQHMYVETARRNEELMEASQLAEEANRQKTVFIQNVSHQIRTPLNIIMGFAQVLGDNSEELPDEEVKSIIKMMDHNAKTLSRMVLMLFDSSEQGLSEELNSNKQEEVSCNEVARECIDHTHLHFPDLPLPVFETSIPDSLCIHTSRLYLMRSLREILYNSAKYSDGMHLSLKVSDTEHVIRFVFEDQGPGMAEEYRHLMYEPFSKINDLSEGLGLGLPLAKRHITNLGGSLDLDTSYKDGCRFIIELPK